MTETIPSQFSFSKLLAHTFPGVFTTIGIFLVLYSKLSDSTNYDISLKNIIDNWSLLITATGGLIFFGTIAGVVIDSIHHVIEETVLDKIIKKCKWFKEITKNIEEEKKDFLEKYKNKSIKWFYYIGLLPMDKFGYIDENYYCYQECLFNLSISFLFSAITYRYFLVDFGFNELAFYVSISFIALSLFCFHAG